MDPGFITPFICSIRHVFSTMLQLQIDVGAPALNEGSGPSAGIAAVIDVDGDVRGRVVLCFEKPCAEALASTLCGGQVGADHEDFSDAIRELASITCAGARAIFAKTPGRSVSIARPRVVTGDGRDAVSPQDAACVLLPCHTEMGEFSIEMSLRDASECREAGAREAA